MVTADPKSTARSLGVWTPKAGQLVLAGAGVTAWLVAIILALISKGEAVATAFVVAGAPLIVAAAFYARVRKVGKDGVEVDPLLQGLEALDSRLPATTDEAALKERGRVLDAAAEVVVASADPIAYFEEPDRSLDHLLDPVDRGVQRYERALQLDQAAHDWLNQAGFVIQSPAADRGVDYICIRPGEGVYAFEVKSSREGRGGPTPEALHSYFRQARVWVDENIGQVEPFYRVLITDVVPPPTLRDRYRDTGIGIVRIEPENGSADWVLSPRNSR
jgi:hypothetical protein